MTDRVATPVAAFNDAATNLASLLDNFAETFGMQYLGMNMEEFAHTYAASLRNLVSIYEAALTDDHLTP